MKLWSLLLALSAVLAAGSTAFAEGRPHVCRWDPPVARNHHQTGTVTISFSIKTDGYVEKLEVANSSGFPELDNAALWCASYWHYLPATENGQAIEVPWSAAVAWSESAAGSRSVSVTEIPPHLNDTSVAGCGSPRA